MGVFPNFSNSRFNSLDSVCIKHAENMEIKPVTPELPLCHLGLEFDN